MAELLPSSTTQGEILLKDIHLPASPDFWPPALGWWLLLLLLLVIIAWLTIKLRHKAKLKDQQKSLLAQLKIFEDKLKNKPNNETMGEINTLLRQLAISAYPRAKIASLTGKEWLTFLDKSGKTEGFSKGAGRILIEAPYQIGEPQNLNLDEFIILIRGWVKSVLRYANSSPNKKGGSNE